MRPRITAVQVTDSITKWEGGTSLITFCRKIDIEEKFDIYAEWWINVGSKPCSFCAHYTDGRGSVAKTCNGCPLRIYSEIPCHPSWCMINNFFPHDNDKPPNSTASRHAKAVWVRIFNNEARIMLEDIERAVA